MTEIQRRLSETMAGLPGNVTLVAVSKFHPVSSLQEAYDGGARIFGESRAQELVAKHVCSNFMSLRKRLSLGLRLMSAEHILKVANGVNSIM